MKKFKRKIIVGAVFFGCLAAVIGGGTVISEKAESVPTSVSDWEEETPVIILDAGHGECS